MADDDDNDDGTMIPVSRLNQEIKKRGQVAAQLEEAHTKLREATARVKELEPQATGYETLTGEVKRLNTELEAERAARAEDIAIIGTHKIPDPELVRFEYGRATKGQKDAPGLADWLGGLKPDDAPAALREFIKPADEGGDDVEDKKDTPARKGSSGGGAGAAPPAGGAAMTPEKAREIRDRCIASGDWSEWRKATGAE